MYPYFVQLHCINRECIEISNGSQCKFTKRLIRILTFPSCVSKTKSWQLSRSKITLTIESEKSHKTFTGHRVHAMNIR